MLKNAIESGQLTTLGDLPPHTVIEIEPARLGDFEDVVAANIHPEMLQAQQRIWNSRSGLWPVLNPGGYITRLELEVMPEPYEQLLTANQRGWKLQELDNSMHTVNRDPEVRKSYFGFAVFGEITTLSGRDTRGQMQAEIWYGKTGHGFTIDRVRQKGGSMEKLSGMPSVKRLVTHPRVEEDATKYADLQDRTNRIGFETVSRFF